MAMIFGDVPKRTLYFARVVRHLRRQIGVDRW